MNRHPGGEEQTIHLLKSIELKKGMKALDLGAGEGETVRIMKAFGLNVQGVDFAPRSSEVQQGDFLTLQYAADSMDLCISQCAFFVSRDQKKAVSECWRVLKKGGFLLLSDLDPGNLLEIVKETGFTILCQEDQTALWREYYLEAIWNDSFCCEDHKLLQKEYKGSGWVKIYGTDGLSKTADRQGKPLDQKQGATIQGYYNVLTHEINMDINYNMMNVHSDCFLQKVDKHRIDRYDEEVKQYQADLVAYKKQKGEL